MSAATAPQLAGFFVEESPALPLVGVSLSFSTGSALDPVGKEGATRLMSRLVRRTGAGRSAIDTDLLLDSLGGSLGAEAACSTVGLHGGVIARNVGRFIEVLSDVVCRPAFRTDEFELLLREARGELIEGLDNDRSLARRWHRRHLFQEHPYGRLPSGTLESLARVTLDDVERLYRASFVRSSLHLGLSGDVLRGEAERYLAQLTSGLPEGPRLPDDVPEPIAVPGRRLVIVDKPERTQTQILIGGLGSHPSDPDHTALHVANTIFGGTFTARLCQEVRAKRGWSYGASSSLPYDRRRQAFTLWTFPKADDAAPCIALQLQMLTELREKGITKSELAAAKKYLVRSHAFSLDTASKRLGLLVDAALYQLPARYYEEYTQRVSEVSLDDVNAAIRTRIPAADLLVTVVGTNALIGDSVRAAMGDLASSEVIPFDRPD